MSAIQNLQTFDPFADATKGNDRLPSGTDDYIHIRIQQRNGRKTLTTVQGIAIDYDKKKLVKAFKKKFACNGTVIEHPEYGEVIQLQGDQRKNICTFLIEVGLTLVAAIAPSVYSTLVSTKWSCVMAPTEGSHRKVPVCK
uniref:SUI1 domain-containing protein n=1 Tax=Oncorhynchus tshawytscha TaxID=74940 RepID=A0AAZ3SSJ7_ONCTS